MKFGEAIEAMKTGATVYRKGDVMDLADGKQVTYAITFVPAVEGVHGGVGMFVSRGMIGMQIWAPRQEDICADDWLVVGQSEAP